MFRHAFAIFVVCVSLRAAYARVAYNPYSNTKGEFENPALRILKEGKYYFPRSEILVGPFFQPLRNFPEKMMAFREPGFALILAGLYGLFGYNNWPLCLLHVLLNSLMCVFLLWIGDKMISRRAGLVAAWLGCFFFSMITYVVHVYVVLINAFLLTLLYWLVTHKNCASWKWLAAASALIGVGTMIKPEIGLIAPFIWWSLLKQEPFRRHWLRNGVLLCAGTFVLQAAWAVRNYMLLGDWLFVRSSTGTYFFLVQDWKFGWSRQFHQLPWEPWPVLNEVEHSRYLVKKYWDFLSQLSAWEIFRTYSWRALQQFFPFYGDGSYDFTFTGLLPFCFLAVVVNAWRSALTLRLLAAPYLVFNAFYIFVQPSHGYRQLLSPLFLLLSSMGILWCWDQLSRWRSLRLGLFGAWTAAHVFLFFHLDSLKPLLRSIFYGTVH
ncbi:MAG: glycosyltransferase family 39 protein [Elusimicrobia bacterium]|nr:glycosyltransferase family 39 protein [Elusimicrobiota bacterium]